MDWRENPLVREILKSKTPGAGRRVKMDRRGKQGEEYLDTLPGDILIRAMRGPRDLYGEFSAGGGGTSPADAVVAGTGFVVMAGAL